MVSEYTITFYIYVLHPLSPPCVPSLDGSASASSLQLRRFVPLNLHIVLRVSLFLPLSAITSTTLCVIGDRTLLEQLANRPGFPFLGNDLFRVCGDVFSCHVIGNADLASLTGLVQKYGPDVPPHMIRSLVDAVQVMPTNWTALELCWRCCP